MSAAASSPTGARVHARRLHSFRSPSHQGWNPFLALLVLWAIMATLLWLEAGASGSWLALEDGEFGPDSGSMLLALAFTLFVTVVFAVRVWRMRRARRAAWTARRSRLACFELSPDAPSRFPHRLLEAAMIRQQLRRLSFPLKAAVLDRIAFEFVVDRLPRGAVVVAQPQPLHGMRLPAELSWPFEPRDALDPQERSDLVAWEAQASGRTREWVAEFGSPIASELRVVSARERGLRDRPLPLWRILCRILVHLLCLLTVLGPVTALTVIAWRTNPALSLTLVLPIALLVAIARWGKPKSVWLVPGGVICCGHAFGRRKGRAIYARRMDTPLVLNLVAGRAYIRVAGRPHRLSFGWPHLIAWVASAPSPSVEAVQAMLGDDVEITLAGGTGEA